MKAIIKETKGNKVVLTLSTPEVVPTENTDKPSTWVECYNKYSDSKAALQWASDLNAVVKSIKYNDNNSMELTLKFYDEHDFNHFTTYFDVVMYGYRD